MNKNVELARKLRKNATTQERIVWEILRAHRFYGYEFRRQYPIGDYIVDFVCREKKIIIELDGGQHNTDVNIEYDNARTMYLEAKGYKVIRFWNNEIDKNKEGFYLRLKKEFNIHD